MSPAKRLITIDIAPATDTHCGGCPCVDDRQEACGAFRKTPKVDNWGGFLRLPECIAAEKGTMK